METLLIILLFPFVFMFAMEYIKKYDPPKQRRKSYRRKRRRKW